MRRACAGGFLAAGGFSGRRFPQRRPSSRLASGVPCAADRAFTGALNRTWEPEAPCLA